MPMTSDDSRYDISRRSFVGSSLATVVAVSRAAGQVESAAPDPDCRRCGGLGRVPLAAAKPFVWLRGTAAPKAEAIVGEEFCPVCQPGGKPAVLVAEGKRRIDAALEKNK